MSQSSDQSDRVTAGLLVRTLQDSVFPATLAKTIMAMRERLPDWLLVSFRHIQEMDQHVVMLKKDQQFRSFIETDASPEQAALILVAFTRLAQHLTDDRQIAEFHRSWDALLRRPDALSACRLGLALLQTDDETLRRADLDAHGSP